MRKESLPLITSLGSSLMSVVYGLVPGTPIVEGGDHTAEYAGAEKCVLGVQTGYVYDPGPCK